jgi:dTDP-4-amino-4,6-dideoxygalactose transaminase
MTSNNNIPFLDLITQHVQLEDELVAAFRSALQSAGFIGGPQVEAFESEFAQFCDTKYCVGVASGTDALRFAFAALGIGNGDIVVTVPHTFIATTEAISQVSAQPEFVDIDERTYNMDPVKLERYFESECVRGADGGLMHRESKKKVKAIVPVHLYGQMADMDRIMELAEKYNLIVIEDACQAHGAEYFSRKENRWKKTGSIGHATAFSFYPGKNLGACGEAGAVTTNDLDLSRKIKMIRDHGQAKKYYHDIEGYNGRLDAIQANFLRIKLKHLAEWNTQRRERAAHYNQLFAQQADTLVLPHEPSWSKGIYHLYVVRTQNREALMAHLNAAGIGTGIHYPIPLHLQKAYASLRYKKGDFPICEKIAAEIVSLPMYPHLRADQQSRVAEEITKFAKNETEIACAMSSL